MNPDNNAGWSGQVVGGGVGGGQNRKKKKLSRLYLSEI